MTTESCAMRSSPFRLTITLACAGAAACSLLTPHRDFGDPIAQQEATAALTAATARGLVCGKAYGLARADSAVTASEIAEAATEACFSVIAEIDLADARLLDVEPGATGLDAGKRRRLLDDSHRRNRQGVYSAALKAVVDARTPSSKLDNMPTT